MAIFLHCPGKGENTGVYFFSCFSDLIIFLSTNLHRRDLSVVTVTMIAYLMHVISYTDQAEVMVDPFVRCVNARIRQVPEAIASGQGKMLG